jgi:enoyl-CoA hydratase/carnithine racemase
MVFRFDVFDRQMTDQLLVTSSDDVVTIAFNRPDSLNSLTIELVDELQSVLEELHEDPPRCVLLTGTGDVTTAGVDMEIAEQEYGTGDQKRMEEKYVEIRTLLETFPRPTAMAGKGAVVGAGFGMAIDVDFVVLGADTTLSLPEIKLGLSTHEVVDTLSDIVGVRVAKEICYLGEPIAPERALEVGLVNEVVPEEAVEETARGIVETIAGYDAAYETECVERISDAFLEYQRTDGQ